MRKWEKTYATLLGKICIPVVFLGWKLLLLPIKWIISLFKKGSFCVSRALGKKCDPPSPPIIQSVLPEAHPALNEWDAFPVSGICRFLVSGICREAVSRIPWRFTSCDSFTSDWKQVLFPAESADSRFSETLLDSWWTQGNWVSRYFLEGLMVSWEAS